MRRTAMAFLMLAGLGGCTALYPDPPEYSQMDSISRRTAAAQASWQRQQTMASGAYGPADGSAVNRPALGPYGGYPPRPQTASNWGRQPDFKPAPSTATLQARAPAKAATAPASDKDLEDEQPADTVLPMAYSDKPRSTPAKQRPDEPIKQVALSRLPETAGKSLVVELDQGPIRGAVPGLRMVNNKQITFNFEVKDVGPSGLSGIELWCTRDGRSWKRYNAGSQDSHSIVVHVKEEGLYGFTLLARNGSGQSKEAPASGDPPQVWVMVDLTKPAVQLNGFELRRTPRGPELTVRWNARDPHLAPRPITLSYAEEPTGPWTAIAGGLANNGKYDWPVSPCVPQRFYVRAEAVDSMGNVGIAQTSKPVRIELSPPTPSTASSESGHSGTEAHTVALPPLSSTKGPPAIDTTKPSIDLVDVDAAGTTP